MKFTKLTPGQLAKLSIPALMGRNLLQLAKTFPARWVSDCGRVVVLIDRWMKLQRPSGAHTVEVFAQRRYVYGFNCKIDGSEAYVVNEVIANLADYEFERTGRLLQRMADLGVAMTGGSEMITLPRFHRYQEAK